ncbi:MULTISPECIES: alpha/beta hydrolase [Arthrobacter]|uniref:Alpha/beta hydrolase n=2 Tax=Arthrobacter TaxID=1663 RepID=A0ABU9KIM5_9MICC|nr:alpha/beta hydrolase [Arthrobacter sp. YJM1]MDP5226005.1 alpha/beta hydrolase [Arthrobacter sp. YJM1]
MNDLLAPARVWSQDVLFNDFEQCTLPLGEDEEGPVWATLVRRKEHRNLSHAAREHAWPTWLSAVRRRHGERHAPAVRDVVLYLHGWADYFLQTELADYIEDHGAGFYALDLRKFGRSLQEHQTAGFTHDLDLYDQDIEAALQVIEAEETARGVDPAQLRIHLLGHSLGGLIAPLWAHRHPGRLASVILNSPWLELQGSSLVRSIASQLVEPFARADPKHVFPLPEMPAYWKSVSDKAYGEWHIVSAWRPRESFPIRAGWIRAVMNGHSRVQRGLDIDAPVLVLLSQRSKIQAEYTDELKTLDAVIDVHETAKRALGLSRKVAVFRYKGAIHDIFMSARDVREQAYKECMDWLVQTAAESTAAP